MKKSNLKSLKLNKKLVSNLQIRNLTGGNQTDYGCHWTNDSWCDCETHRNCTDTECHTVWDCEL